MTRQNYQAIAGIIRRELDNKESRTKKKAIFNLVEDLADYMNNDNVRFSRLTFKVAIYGSK